MSFSYKTETLLKHTGWHADRATDIRAYVHTLEWEGYIPFPIVQTFLTQFGGLEITYTSSTDYGNITQSIHFDAASAAEAVYNEGYVSLYAERIGQPVCVIGECSNKSTTLVMDSRGYVYGGFDTHLVLFGYSAEQAIENIINNNIVAKI